MGMARLSDHLDVSDCDYEYVEKNDIERPQDIMVKTLVNKSQLKDRSCLNLKKIITCYQIQYST